MTRDELEHIIRASGDVTDQYEFMIIGSQSILGSIPNPEPVFTMSAEADIYPLPRAAHIDHEGMRILQEAGVAEAVMKTVGNC